MEFHSYTTLAGSQIYQVCNRPDTPKALALLVGPFATERPYSYTAWARWARFLEARGFLTLRFDYRGVGESTGAFTDYVFRDWIHDAVHCGESLQHEAPHLPLVVHGLGFGGLIAGQAFAAGIGRALLTWSAPSSGKEAMKDAFSRRLMMDFVTAGPKRKTWDDYVAQLDAGGSITVQGYDLTGRLWKEAQAYILPAATTPPAPRPVHHVKLGRDAAPLVAGLGQWRALNPALQTGFVPLNPDHSRLFTEQASWIEAAVAQELHPHA